MIYCSVVMNNTIRYWIHMFVVLLQYTCMCDVAQTATCNKCVRPGALRAECVSVTVIEHA